MLKRNFKLIKIIVIVIILAVLTAILIKRCKTPVNQLVTDISIPIKQNEIIIKVNDSTKGIKQDVLISYDKSIIRNLQDSILSLLAKNAKLTSTLNISFKETYVESNATGKLRDSLSVEFDKLINTYKDGLTTAEEFDKAKKELFSKKIPYSISSKYRKQKGLIDYNGNILNDSLEIYSEPIVAFGTTNKFLQRPKYSVVIGNKNPLITISDAKSITYVPPVKTQISFGPQILSDGKTLTAGAGLNIKRGIFSISLGYTLYNSKL